MSLSVRIARSLISTGSVVARSRYGVGSLLYKVRHVVYQSITHTHTQALSTSVPRCTDEFYRGFPLTTTLSEATTTHTSDSLPTYRVMNEGGVVIDPQQDPKVV